MECYLKSAAVWNNAYRQFWKSLLKKLKINRMLAISAKNSTAITPNVTETWNRFTEFECIAGQMHSHAKIFWFNSNAFIFIKIDQFLKIVLNFSRKLLLNVKAIAIREAHWITAGTINEISSFSITINRFLHRPIYIRKILLYT